MKIDINFCDVVKDIFKRVSSSGEEIFLVGGRVRDFFLNVESDDYDFCTSCPLDKLLEIFKDEKLFYKNKRWKTLSFFKDEKEIEITSYSDSSFDEDLKRRDFTIDSLAVDKDKNVFKLGSSLEDLNDRVIRFNSPKEEVIKSDPLRMLRAIRLASTLDLKIEDESKSLILKYAPLIKTVSKERVAKEMSKFIVSNDSAKYIDEYYLLFSELIDELKDMDGFEQNNRYHVYDVKDHTLKVLDSVEKRTEVTCLAALFHDLGKPASYFLDAKGVGHFHGHALVSAALAETYLTNFNFPKKEVNKIVKLIHYHDYPIDDRIQVKKLLGKVGEDLIEDMLVLKRADIMGQNPSEEYICRLDRFEEIEKWVREIIDNKECYSLNTLDIDGNDIKSLGKFDGEEIGIILHRLLKNVMEEKIVNEKEVLINYVKKNYLR